MRMIKLKTREKPKKSAKICYSKESMAIIQKRLILSLILKLRRIKMTMVMMPIQTLVGLLQIKAWRQSQMTK